MELLRNLPFLSIIIPMIFAVVVFLVNNDKLNYYITLAVTFCIFIFSIILMVNMYNNPDGFFTTAMGHFPAPFSNEMRAGSLEAILAATFSLIMFITTLAGKKEVNTEVVKGKRSYFYLLLLFICSSIMVMVYSNDIFTTYVFVEINTVAACGIVVIKESGKTILATIKYLMMSVLGSGLFLFAVSTLYGITGHLTMNYAHQSIVGIMQTKEFYVPLLVTLSLFTVAIAIKSALFPFHTWLPDAHGSSITPASAILSSLVLKGYIVIFLKLIFRVYGVDVVEQLGVLNVVLVLGLIAIMFGSVMAMMQKDIKRVIAYSTVSQIGYIFTAIGLGSTLGYVAAVFHIIVHAFTKSMLFISAGSLSNTAESKNIFALKGVAKYNKTAAFAFLIGSLSMVGVPVLAGFSSKFVLANAVLSESVKWLVLIVLAVSSLLNALYYIPIDVSLYSGNPTKTLKTNKNPEESWALRILIVMNILIGVSFPLIIKVIENGIKWFN